MIDLGRRRFFGLLAAPAIISITGKLQPALILPSGMSEMAFDVDQRILDMPTRGMDPSAFRRIVEPALREVFAKVWEVEFERARVDNDKLFIRATMGRTPRGDDELRKIRRQLPGLPPRRHDA